LQYYIIFHATGKCIAIIVDSGPGKVNTMMLAELRLRGFYLIPGVPNTTHVTQTTGRNYGPFKMKYHDNLSKLTEQRVRINKTIQLADIILRIFGDQDDTGVTLHNSFQCAFGFDCNVKVWAKIGVKPFDRNCLQDDKVRHEVVTLPDGTIDVDADPLSTKLVNIEDLIKKSTDLLSIHGLNGSVFWKKAPRLDQLKMNTVVMAPLSRERQDLLMNAVSTGSRFHATSGEHLNSGVIQYFRTSKNKNAYNDGEATDIKVSDLKILYKWKHGKNPKVGLNKVALCGNLIAHKDNNESEVSK